MTWSSKLFAEKYGCLGLPNEHTSTFNILTSDHISTMVCELICISTPWRVVITASSQYALTNLILHTKPSYMIPIMQLQAGKMILYDMFFWLIVDMLRKIG